MKKIKILIAVLIIGINVQGQFANTAELRSYIDQYITNNAINAFQNKRLNTALKGLISQVDSSNVRIVGGVRVVDTLYLANDSTIVFKIKNSVTSEVSTYSLPVATSAGGGGVTLNEGAYIDITGTTVKLDTALTNPLYTMHVKASHFAGLGTSGAPLDIKNPNIVETVPTAFRTMSVTKAEAHRTLYRTVEIIPYGRLVSTFHVDTLDITTADDGFMVFVDGNGIRYKRDYGEDGLNPEWFGAHPDDGLPDDVGFNACSDWILQRGYVARSRKIDIPIGTYHFSNPWIVHAYGIEGTTDYSHVTIHIAGRVTGKTGVLNTVFMKTPGVTYMNDKMIMNVQKGYDVLVEGIVFQGNNTVMNGWSATEFFNHKWADWNFPGEVYKRKAPVALVTLDAFSNDSTGGYTGLGAWYKAVSNGGGTNITFKYCSFRSSSVGIAVSCNQWSNNADMISVEQSSMVELRDGWAGGNGQSRSCKMEDIQLAYVHTTVNTWSFGSGQGTPPVLDKVLWAGGCKQIAWNTSVDAPIKMTNCYAESLYRVGLLSGAPEVGTSNQSTVVNTELNIYAPAEASLGGLFKGQDWIGLGHINFINSKLIYSTPTGTTDSFRLPMQGRGQTFTFTGGTTGAGIYSAPSVYNISSTLHDTKVSFNGVKVTYPGQNIPGGDLPYNRFNTEFVTPDKLANEMVPNSSGIQWEDVPGVHINMEWNQAQRDQTFFLAAKSVTVDTLGIATFTATTDEQKLFRKGDIILTDTTYNAKYSDWMPGYYDDAGGIYRLRDYAPIMGIVHSVVGTTVTLWGAGVNVLNGTATYNLYVNHVRNVQPPIAATLTAGNDTLKNVEFYTPTIPGTTFTPSVGQRLEHQYIPIGAYIKAVDLGARTIVMSKVVTGSVTKTMILNGNPRITVNSVFSPTEIKALAGPSAFFGGSQWIQNTNVAGVPKTVVSIINSTILENHASRTLDVNTLATPDLTNYVTTNGAQLITGAKEVYNIPLKVSADGTNTAQLDMYSIGTGAALINWYRGNVQRYAMAATTNNDFAFYQIASGTYPYYIDGTTGNIGIGVPSNLGSTYKLLVAGKAGMSTGIDLVPGTLDSNAFPRLHQVVNLIAAGILIAGGSGSDFVTKTGVAPQTITRPTWINVDASPSGVISTAGQNAMWTLNTAGANSAGWIFQTGGVSKWQGYLAEGTGNFHIYNFTGGHQAMSITPAGSVTFRKGGNDAAQTLTGLDYITAQRADTLGQAKANLASPTFTGTVTLPHIAGSGASPGIAAGTAAGTGPTVTMITGSTDLAGEISVLTGSAPAANNVIVTITTTSGFGAVPVVTFAPSNAAAADVNVYVTRVSSTQFQLAVTAVALPATTQLKWTYTIIQ